MSFNPTPAFVKQYESMVTMAAQQEESRLVRTCLQRNLVGEEGYLEQLEGVTVTERTTRFAEVPVSDITHKKRKYITTTYENRLLLDPNDDVQMLINRPQHYAMQQAAAFAQNRDSVIITNALGTAYTGKAGTTEVTFDSGQVLAVDLEVTSTNTNLTMTKLRRARTKLKQAETLKAGQKAFLICTANQIENLLEDSTVTSSDFNTIKALVAGELNTYMGFEFIVTELLPKSGDIRTCLAYTADALTFVNSRPLTTTMDRLPERGNVLQVYSCERLGAVRNFENKIVSILCDETK